MGKNELVKLTFAQQTKKFLSFFFISIVSLLLIGGMWGVLFGLFFGVSQRTIDSYPILDILIPLLFYGIYPIAAFATTFLVFKVALPTIKNAIYFSIVYGFLFLLFFLVWKIDALWDPARYSLVLGSASTYISFLKLYAVYLLGIAFGFYLKHREQSNS